MELTEITDDLAGAADSCSYFTAHDPIMPPTGFYIPSILGQGSSIPFQN
jgi:hypothetical protein